MDSYVVNEGGTSSMGLSDQSAVVTALLDRKVYYFLFPLLPGGLLVLCVLVGKPELRTVVLTSEGFGYIFRISMLLATAWVVGGVVFLFSFVLTAFVAAKVETRDVKPWTIAIWQQVVKNTFGNNLVQAKEELEWKQLYLALQKTFPDESEEEGVMLGTLLLSSGLAFALGTIWWPGARLPGLYVAVVIVVLLGLFLIYVISQNSSQDLACRQIGMLLRHKLDVEKRKDDSVA
jgi:hypothetical protein